MDELAARLVRSAGSRLRVNVMLGGSVTVLCDEGRPPLLVIDAGPMQVLVEPAVVDDRAVEVADPLPGATARFRDLVTTAVASQTQIDLS